jgi:hypothetical protein
MKQPSASGISFREVDQDGNPEGGAPAAAQEPSREGPHLPINPFIAVLWLLATLLVGGGIWVLSNGAFNPGPISGPAALSFLMMTFAPHAILIGLAFVFCLLFWHAVQWQRRRP